MLRTPRRDRFVPSPRQGGGSRQEKRGQNVNHFLDRRRIIESYGMSYRFPHVRRNRTRKRRRGRFLRSKTHDRDLLPVARLIAIGRAYAISPKFLSFNARWTTSTPN